MRRACEVIAKADTFRTAAQKLIGGGLIVAATVSLALPAAAETPSRRAPTSRAPSVKGTSPGDAAATSLARKKPPAAPTPNPAITDDEEKLPPLFNLPVASRTRMRQCGEKWQAMKMSGEAGEDVWRDFATKCLAAEADPFDKKPR